MAARVSAERFGATTLMELADADSVLGIGCKSQVLCVGVPKQALRNAGPSFFIAMGRHSAILFESLGEVDERSAVEFEECAKKEVFLAFGQRAVSRRLLVLIDQIEKVTEVCPDEIVLHETERSG